MVSIKDLIQKYKMYEIYSNFTENKDKFGHTLC